MGPRSSRPRATRASRPPGPPSWLRAVFVAALVGATGCGGSGASPPAPADPGIRRGPASEKAPSGVPEARESTPRLDPSEEITPEELASIPEPLPAAPTTLKGVQDQPMDRVAQSPSEVPSGASQVPRTTSPAPAPGYPAWSVQIYASERREEAERVSREASQALAARGAVEREGALFKVRLGRFATEAEAQALREQAIRAGYSGAFRIKTTH